MSTPRRTVALEANLSFRARGIMALLYELPSDAFPITLDFLVDSGIEGRDALRTTVDELLAQGILERRQNTERGRFARSGLYIAERWEK